MNAQLKQIQKDLAEAREASDRLGKAFEEVMALDVIQHVLAFGQRRLEHPAVKLLAALAVGGFVCLATIELAERLELPEAAHA